MSKEQIIPGFKSLFIRISPGILLNKNAALTMAVRWSGSYVSDDGKWILSEADKDQWSVLPTSPEISYEMCILAISIKGSLEHCIEQHKKLLK